MSKHHLTAAEASTRLNISPASLYAYVSRGLLRSEAGEGPSRARRYLVEDVDRLRSRKEGRRDPNKVAQKALHWGSPVLDSAITKIDAGQLCYRGENVRDLARTKSVEEVTALIWRGATDVIPWSAVSLTPHDRDALRRVKTVAARLHPSEQFEILLPLAAAHDETAFDLRPAAVARTGARIVRLLTESVCGQTARNGIARALARRFAPDIADAERLISAALILCADHELNVSAFTARVVASGGSTPYSVVAAGLHALSGVRHGGESLRVEAMLQRSTNPRDARAFISTTLRAGERVAGFGHQLYPDGDPRAQHLIEELRARRKKLDPIGEAMIDAMFDLAAEHPTVDFALALLTRTLNLPQGSPLTLFALGRSIGFIGHAIEQYETGEMIRPRARYTGR